MKKSLILVVLTFLGACQASAQIQGAVDCTPGKSISVWENPGSMVVVKQISCGRIVSVLGIEGGYLKIECGENCLGYIESRYFRSSQIQEESGGRIAELEAQVETLEKQISASLSTEASVSLNMQQKERQTIQPASPRNPPEAWSQIPLSNERIKREFPRFVSFAREKAKFSIYVDCVQESGFVDSDAADSVKDIKGILVTKRGGFALADSPEKADIVLMVTGRYSGSEIIGSQTSVGRGIFGGLIATSTPIRSNYRYLAAHMKVGDYEKDLYSSAAYWRMSAFYLIEQLKRWVKINERQLLQQKQ